MKKLISVMVFLVICLISCETYPKYPTVNYSYPRDGVSNNADIVTKDFISLGVIFVNSVEIIDGDGNHTGSKITYEMLMREAVKLGADDVINIKIDVNQKEERQVSSNDDTVITVVTYSYTATGLAIKYTDAVVSGTGGGTGKARNAIIPVIADQNNTPSSGSKSNRGKIIGITLGTTVLVAGVITLVSFLIGQNNESSYSY